MKTSNLPAADNSATAPVRVLVVGQVPPPFHGQSLMIKMLLDGDMPGIKLHHVPMAFSGNLDQVGRFQIAKVVHLAVVILKIIYCRFRFQSRILYYPPAGPNLIPLVRDIAILLSTRWLFSKTVFHFQASGVSELIARLPAGLRWLAKLALSRPDAAIQLSELTTPDASELDAQRTYTIPNACHDEAQRMQFERPLRAVNSILKILYVGTVCEGKGILVLLKACAEARLRGCELQVDIVGSYQPADFQQSVERCLAELQLHDVVKIWGQKTGAAKWERFAAADVLCFPSHYQSESFGCVLVEAMCFSMPVLSTLWRGIPSIVEHGKTGFLVAPEDHSQLSEYIENLAGDVVLCTRLGAAGREKYCQQYTSEKYVYGLRQVFLETGLQVR